MYTLDRPLAAALALGALAWLVLALPAAALPFTTVSFTAPCSDCPDAAGWGNPASVSGSLTFDGDPTGGVTFSDSDLVAWSVQIGTITFDETNSSPSMYTTQANTLELNAALEVVTAGIEFALDAVLANPVDNVPFWMQVNKSASGFGVLEFSSYEAGPQDPPSISVISTTTPIEFPYDGKAGILTFSTGVVIPEPATLGLIGLGLMGLGLRRREG